MFKFDEPQNQTMTKPSVTVSPLHHRGTRRSKIEFAFDEAIISQPKDIEDRKWSGAGTYLIHLKLFSNCMNYSK
jgi:hypothetical protein